MKGKYEITVESRKTKYNFLIKRKITLLRGASGTGKTTLLRMLSLSQENASIRLKCNAKCVVLSGEYWSLIVEHSKGVIFYR